MTVAWVVEKFRNHEEESERLAEVVTKKGYTLFEYYPWRGLWHKDIEALSDIPVAFHGSCFGAKFFKRECPKASPGAFLSWDNYSCSTYYQHWGSLCLNQPTAKIYPLHTIMKELGTLFSSPKFVRPDSGAKEFTGEVFQNPVEAGTGFFDIIYESHPNFRVVISEPQELGREWRVFYNSIEKSIICGSQYRNKFQLAVEHGIPEHVSKWVSENFSNMEWYPDPLFALDIVEVLSTGTLKLLETSAVNVSGLYASNLPAFVDAMSVEALRQFHAQKNS